MMTERPKPELYLSPLRYFKVDETVLLVRRKRNGYFIVTATAVITVDKDMKVKAKVNIANKLQATQSDSRAKPRFVHCQANDAVALLLAEQPHLPLLFYGVDSFAFFDKTLPVKALQDFALRENILVLYRPDAVELYYVYLTLEN